MKQRLFKAIDRLEQLGWSPKSKLIIVLTKIAKESSVECIEDIFEAFR